MERVLDSPMQLVKNLSDCTPKTAQETIEYIGGWYENLYSNENFSLSEAEKLLANTLSFPLSMTKDLTAEISSDTIKETVLALSNEMSPGPDGLTYEFYKTSIDQLLFLLYLLFNNIID